MTHGSNESNWAMDLEADITVMPLDVLKAVCLTKHTRHILVMDKTGIRFVTEESTVQQGTVFFSEANFEKFWLSEPTKCIVMGIPLATFASSLHTFGDKGRFKMQFSKFGENLLLNVVGDGLMNESKFKNSKGKPMKLMENSDSKTVGRMIISGSTLGNVVKSLSIHNASIVFTVNFDVIYIGSKSVRGEKTVTIPGNSPETLPFFECLEPFRFEYEPGMLLALVPSFRLGKYVKVKFYANGMLETCASSDIKDSSASIIKICTAARACDE
uniref:DNA_pol3_beta_2 domain-containing protein n=1 Tax=Rhabditophanes sp. KR3021 TaxID=114890 RepID=A0AC35UEN1_9BILA